MPAGEIFLIFMANHGHSVSRFGNNLNGVTLFVGDIALQITKGRPALRYGSIAGGGESAAHH